MQVRAIRNDVSPEAILSGYVSSVAKGCFTIVLADGSTLDARKAVSCLVEPALDDRVLIAGTERTSEYYVIAVLERCEPGVLRVVAESGLEISACAGTVSIEGDQVAITGKRRADITSPTLQLGATELRLVFRELAAWGQQIVLRTETMRAIAQHAHVMLDSVHSRFARSTKVVSELEHTSAKHLSYSITETLSMHSKTSVLTAEELLKLDGKLVQIG